MTDPNTDLRLASVATNTIDLEEVTVANNRQGAELWVEHFEIDQANAG